MTALGFNYRIDEARCALGLHRLEHLDSDNARRARIDARYRMLLADVPGVKPASLPPAAAPTTLAHHLFTIVLDPRLDRDAVRAALAGEGFRPASITLRPTALRYTLSTRRRSSSAKSTRAGRSRSLSSRT